MGRDLVRRSPVQPRDEPHPRPHAPRLSLLARREAALAAREPALVGRMEAAQAILTAADTRDASADTRDAAAEKGENDMDRAEFASPRDKGRYGGDWPERRNAAADRALEGSSNSIPR